MNLKIFGNIEINTLHYKMETVLDFIPFDIRNINRYEIVDSYNIMNTLENVGNNVIHFNNDINKYINSYMNAIIGYTILNWEYVSVILSSFTICFIIGLLFSLLDKEIKHSDNIIISAISANSDNKKNSTDKVIVNVNNVTYPTGLYCESIRELVSKNNDIISKMEHKHEYWILLRVIMKNPMNMKRSKYQLHSNNVGNSRNRVFKTRDMYMIFKLRYFNGENINTNVAIGNNGNNGNNKVCGFNMVNSIVGCMNNLNYYSPEEYKTCDFVVLAICNKSNYNNPKEFYDGLINNNYEMYNFKDIVININQKIQIGYSLMLPVHEVYDIFMDVYNINLFESNKYSIDDENYESWNDKSINELKF